MTENTANRSRSRARGVVFIAWGERYTSEAVAAVRRSPGLSHYPKFLVTDRFTEVDDSGEIEVIRVDFALEGMLRKSEFHKHLPQGFDSFVFLDTDVTVIGNVSFGFEKAEECGFALAQANHYLLPEFKTFGRIMAEEGVEDLGQVQFNAGVVFFSTAKKSLDALDRWEKLIHKWGHGRNARLTDQPFLSFALIQAGINPYPLSRNYNYRPQGGPVIGEVRIWHSWHLCPEGVNGDKSKWREFDSKSGQMKLLDLRKPTVFQRAKDAAYRLVKPLVRGQ